MFDRYRSNEDFIQKFIFSGGFLPSLNFMKKLIKKNKLNIETINSYPDHYAQTLSTWRKNFFKAWGSITPLGFESLLKKCGSFIFSYCEAGFKSKNIDLIQLSLSNK